MERSVNLSQRLKQSRRSPLHYCRATSRGSEAGWSDLAIGKRTLRRRAPLERQLQSELDLSRVQSRGSDHSIGHCSHGCTGLPKDWVVREIEELRAKIHPYPLGDAELFRHGEIQSDNARPDDVVPPAIAEAVRSHAWRETDAVHERGQVIPVVRCWI